MGWEDPLEEEMPTRSSVLFSEISWTETHGGHGQRSIVHGVARVGHELVTIPPPPDLIFIFINTCRMTMRCSISLRILI